MTKHMAASEELMFGFHLASCLGGSQEGPWAWPGWALNLGGVSAFLRTVAAGRYLRKTRGSVAAVACSIFALRG